MIFTSNRDNQQPILQSGLSNVAYLACTRRLWIGREGANDSVLRWLVLILAIGLDFNTCGYRDPSIRINVAVVAYTPISLWYLGSDAIFSSIYLAPSQESAVVGIKTGGR